MVGVNAILIEDKSLLRAPKPYNKRSGMTRRAYDVPLVNQWFHEHCAQDYPVKVRIAK